MELKRCSNCNEMKSLDNFHKRKDSKDGYNTGCKSCRSNKSKEYYKLNKEKILSGNKEYYNNNKDKHNEWCKRYYQEHISSLNKYYKDYREKNKQHIKEYLKQRYELNREDILHQQKIYSQTPKGKLGNVRRAIKYNARRKRQLGWNLLYLNPFSNDIRVVGHHINNNDIVYIPEDLHQIYAGYDRDTHREILYPIICQIYPMGDD